MRLLESHKRRGCTRGCSAASGTPPTTRRSGIGRLFIIIAAAFTTVLMSLSALAVEAPAAVAAAYGALDLGTLGGNSSEAIAVNSTGQVVGGSSTASGATHAFSWTAAGGMVDLGTLGGDYSEAVAVNDSGQVVGGSSTASGATHALFLDRGGRHGRPRHPRR